MKKILAFALCLCALLSMSLTLRAEEPAEETEVVSTLSKKNDKPVVRNGDPSEGIYLL